jgi:hypothetical protein
MKDKLIRYSFIGMVIALYDYWMATIWLMVIDRDYMCISNSDGTGEICTIFWSTSPMMLYAFTALGVGVTAYFIYKVSLQAFEENDG